MGTLTYLTRRLLLALVTLFGITLVTFAIIALAPGDPAALQMREGMSPEQAAAQYEEIAERFNLDEPIPVRYWLWLKGLLVGDLGTSMSDGRPVFDKIRRAFWPTASVNVLGIAIAFMLSVPIGIYSAWRQDGVFDRVGSVVLYALYSIPNYVGAVVLILFVGIKWDLLPWRGMRGDEYASLSMVGKGFDQLQHMALYVTCVAYASLAYFSRFVRSNLLEVTRQDYIRTAMAKGLDDRTVVIKHAFRNTLIPFVTLLGLMTPIILSGSVILEVMFTWPGLGRLFFNGILERDYPLVMALSTASAVLVLIGTLAADLLYGVVDPRVSHG